jgi:glycosyltransferase involved in cell wall biosynthesis
MVSIIIPYNKDRGYLNECRLSILRQTYTDIQVIPVRSDNTVGYNFNRGLELAEGELVKYVCEDDWLPLDAIEILVNGMGEHPWVCANSFMVDYTETFINKSTRLTFAEAIEQNGIHGGTTLYRTELLRDIGGMDESLETAEEYDMHLNLMYFGYMPGYIDRNVYCYRIWQQQKGRKDRENRIEWRKAQHEMIKDRYR